MKALIFDFDGLIIDTEMPDYLSWQEIYRDHGVELPLDLWASIVGGTADSDFDPYDYLEELVGEPIDREGIWIKRRKRDIDLIVKQPILPGVIDYIQDAGRLGLKLAIASSSPESWVVGHLTRLDLIGHFDCICTADDVTKTKPDPALLLAVLSDLDITASDCLMFEDSPNGITAANRAKIFCVCIPNELTVQLDLDHAGLKLNSLADISLSDLIKKFEKLNK
ncbi:MAG: HAD-IA family hydrolase [Chloroflexi bacterium]|nr:HAD-IA family hydrolase [Chloroflexota bacterium]